MQRLYFFQGAALGLGTMKFGGAKLAGRKVEGGKSNAVVMAGERAEKIVFLRPGLCVNGGARGEHPRDFASHQLGCQLRVLHLVANRDLISLAHELADIAFGGVVGHSAHGNGNAFFLVAGGKRYLQLARGYDRVVEEKLVEIAHAKKQQRARVLFLNRGVLPHQGRGRFVIHRRPTRRLRLIHSDALSL